ncbi:MAG TPA: Ig-like domain-containing protein [Pyrinomonadaceae bacterium]|jgi:uncharacterized repeat protein (TIGR01451 family)
MRVILLSAAAAAAIIGTLFLPAAGVRAQTPAACDLKTHTQFQRPINAWDGYCSEMPVDNVMWQGTDNEVTHKNSHPSGKTVGGTKQCASYPRVMELVFTHPVADVEVWVKGATSVSASSGATAQLSGSGDRDYDSLTWQRASFTGGGITSITISSPIEYDVKDWHGDVLYEDAWEIQFDVYYVSENTYKQCNCARPAFARPQPQQITNVYGWSMLAEVTDDDGLVLKDVRLGQRYMANRISVPYYTLETSALPKQSGELKPAGFDLAMRSRLVDYHVSTDDEKLTVEATYVVDRIPSTSGSCLQITQRYEFYRQGLLPCEPTGTLSCAKWKPIVKYKFQGQNGEVLRSITIPQRQHHTVDGNIYNSVGVFKDIEGFLDLLSTRPRLQIFTNKKNPLYTEGSWRVVAAGKDIGVWDNFHQTYRSFVEEPSVGWNGTSWLPSKLPGCPECVHTHWRWGRAADGEGGGALIGIPEWSNQDMDIAVVKYKADEEDPADYRTLLDYEPIRVSEATPTAPALQYYRGSRPEQVVYWQSATGHLPDDTFFGYGTFFNPSLPSLRLYPSDPPTPSAGVADAAAQTPSSPAPLSPSGDGLTSVDAAGVFEEGVTTTVTNFDATLPGPLPPGYTLQGDLSYDIQSEGESSGPYVVTFNVASVTDQAAFNNLRVFHVEQDQYDPTKVQWVDRTILPPDTQSPDFANKAIRARSSVLGQFAVALLTQPQAPNTGAADVVLAANTSSPSATAGTNFTYTLNVVNNGPQTATDVLFSDDLSPYMNFVSATPGQGDCRYDEEGGVVCKLGNLNPGASTTVSVVVEPVEDSDFPASGRQAVNTAHAKSGESDPSEANNVVRTTTTVLPNPNKAPAVSISSPAAGALLTAGSDVVVEANASDPDGTVGKVDFYVDGTLLGGGTSVGGNLYRILWGNAPSGEHSLTAIATDNQGRVKTSDLRPVLVNGPATAVITSPLNHSAFTKPPALVLTAAAADAGGVSKVEFYFNAMPLGVGAAAGAGQYNFVWNAPPAGAYTLHAVVTNSAGATTTSAPVKVTINAPPVVSLTTTANGAAPNAPASIGLTAQANDADGIISKVEFFANGVYLGSKSTVGASLFSLNWGNVPAGTYSLTAVATDDLGATATSDPVAVTVNAPPTVSVVSPSSGAQYLTPASLTITASAGDADGGVSRVDFFANGLKVGAGVLTGQNQYAFTWGDVGAGTYSVYAAATDNRGSTTTSAPVSVTVSSAALLITDSTTLGGGDSVVKTRLQSLGYTVTVKDAASSAAADANGKSLVVISSSVAPASVGTKFRTVAVPVVTWESGLFANMGMTTTSTKDFGTITSQTQVKIALPGHPLAANLSGTVTVTSASGTMNWGKPNANAASVATLVSDATRPVVFGYESGAVMPGLTAPARRVGLYLHDTTASVFTAAGQTLFDAAIKWAGGRASLSGRADSFSPNGTVNLTAKGSLDWVHWGMGAPRAVNRKANVSQQISDFTVIGAVSPAWNSINQRAYSWTEGTPTPSVTSTATAAVMPTGVGNGFEFTVPADTNLRTLKVFVGVWDAKAKLEAFLSDGSAPAYADSSLDNRTARSQAVYTVAFRAASAGQTLRVRYTTLADYVPNNNLLLEAATLVYGNDPNVAPAVSITSPSSGATVGAASNVNVTVAASDADGSVNNVDVFANGAYIGTAAPGGGTQFGLVWNCVFAGNYSLTAVATDEEGKKTTSAPVSLVVPGGTGGSLSGSVAVVANARNVNLTTDGTLDWAHWGLGGPAGFNHKAGVLQRISNFSVIGPVAPGWRNDNPTTYTWTDGTPTASVNSSPTEVVMPTGVGNGFEFTVPADTTLRTLKVYVGVWDAKAKLEAALSDASAPAYADSTLNNSTSITKGVYTLNFKAASSGQILRVRYTTVTDYVPNNNLFLEGATLR